MARFRRLKAHGSFQSMLQGGAKAAREEFVPQLKRGQFGISERTIDGAIARCLSAAFEGRGFTDDDQFLYRLGFEAVAHPAKEAALAAVSFGAARLLTAIAAAMPPRLQGERRLMHPIDFEPLPRPRT